MKFVFPFFGVFHGRLNPLTDCSLFETFVVPTMLYGWPGYFLNPTPIIILELFQAEIGKRILGISNLPPSNTHWIAKLTYLADDNLNSNTRFSNSRVRWCLWCQSCTAVLFSGARDWHWLSASMSWESHRCILNRAWRKRRYLGNRLNLHSTGLYIPRLACCSLCYQTDHFKLE